MPPPSSSLTHAPTGDPGLPAGGSDWPEQDDDEPEPDAGGSMRRRSKTETRGHPGELINSSEPQLTWRR
ncbi:hypothetical protein E2562_038753 [Oryza meyeriana var. granulata]|uniref:Uncharacterized protein n=1 Tax=Oryza meyeriana var. granulata TaxID=110450 RepID=A0A6G1BQD8_9ORYZ|nr:hypothetical protein E2562_038753 [Oryza meyeriana var. granulata]